MPTPEHLKLGPEEKAVVVVALDMLGRKGYSSLVYKPLEDSVIRARFGQNGYLPTERYIPTRQDLRSLLKNGLTKIAGIGLLVDGSDGIDPEDIELWQKFELARTRRFSQTLQTTRPITPARFTSTVVNLMVSRD